MPSTKIKTKSRKENRMLSSSENRDLCMTCNYGPTCVRRKHHGKPVWYCEEFDDYQQSKPATVKRIRKSAVKKQSAPLLQGLCTNCENSQVCVIPKTEGGIWHCEEYR